MRQRTMRQPTMREARTNGTDHSNPLNVQFLRQITSLMKVQELMLLLDDTAASVMLNTFLVLYIAGELVLDCKTAYQDLVIEEDSYSKFSGPGSIKNKSKSLAKIKKHRNKLNNLIGGDPSFVVEDAVGKRVNLKRFVRDVVNRKVPDPERAAEFHNVIRKLMEKLELSETIDSLVEMTKIDTCKHIFQCNDKQRAIAAVKSLLGKKPRAAPKNKRVRKKATPDLPANRDERTSANLPPDESEVTRRPAVDVLMNHDVQDFKDHIVVSNIANSLQYLPRDFKFGWLSDPNNRLNQRFKNRSDPVSPCLSTEGVESHVNDDSVGGNSLKSREYLNQPKFVQRFKDMFPHVSVDNINEMKKLDPEKYFDSEAVPSKRLGNLRMTLGALAKRVGQIGGYANALNEGGLVGINGNIWELYMSRRDNGNKSRSVSYRSFVFGNNKINE